MLALMKAPFAESAAIALNRFGLGARPGDSVGKEPRRFLRDQFDRYEPAPPEFALLPDGGLLLQNFESSRGQQRSLRASVDKISTIGTGSAKTPEVKPESKSARKFVQEIGALYKQAVQSRVMAALATDAPFIERMVHFWANHFCISADGRPVTALAGAFERDAIRPHVLGRFEDMLLAVERHPAMLIYLNQNQSIGPNSPAAQAPGRRHSSTRGLNENLAREIMELHTGGVRVGYSQADVTEFARALTGWSVSGLGDRTSIHSNGAVDYMFRADAHEPGERKILGRRYEQTGEGQGIAVLCDLAQMAQTGSHIAFKLARHFVGDAPPSAMVDRLADCFVSSRGNLKALYEALIDSPEVWEGTIAKFKSPWEWIISAMRGLGYYDVSKIQVADIAQKLGQPIWKPGSPAGWDDVDATWAAPDALLRRVQIAQRLSSNFPTIANVRNLARELLPGTLTPTTAEQIASAGSSAVALALMLVSPEFLRR